jgi:hypothetical protein
MFSPGPYTDAIHNDIYASWYTPRNVTPYANALQLSNAELAAVDNDWNNRYYTEKGQKLSEAINGWYSSLFSDSFPDVAEQLVKRLKTIENL